jgi:hypothetical protein
VRVLRLYLVEWRVFCKSTNASVQSREVLPLCKSSLGGMYLIIYMRNRTLPRKQALQQSLRFVSTVSYNYVHNWRQCLEASLESLSNGYGNSCTFRTLSANIFHFTKSFRLTTGNERIVLNVIPLPSHLTVFPVICNNKYHE